MAEFLGNATSIQLLILMVIPLISVILLVGFIVFSFSRRRKKPKMKLGIQPKAPPVSEIPASASITAPTYGLDTEVLSAEQPASSDIPASSAEAGLNMDILSRSSTPENFTMDTPKQTNEEKIDLAARLGNQPVPAAPQPSEPVELLRLLRHPQSGQFIVEVAGRRYTKLADVADKKIGQYILKLVAHLLAFTNGMIATEAGVKSIYTPRVGETPQPLATPSETSAPVVSEPVKSEPSPVAPPSPEAEAAFLASLRAQSPPEPEPQQRRGIFGRSAPTAEPVLPGLNLADEINKIVQARLMASPLATTTQIEITTEPGGGIRINVNGTFYSSPDDVPDPEVKELIKASIKQWEES